MAFNKSDIEDLLVKCHRRCCVCHRYCGVRMEIDHIIPKSEGGKDTLDNAIAVCFDCHAEIHLYNPKHAKGRRFTSNELKDHRDQWLALCVENPVIFASTVPPAEGGALERLLNELIYNENLANAKRPAAMFEVAQFRRAIADGTLSWLKDSQVKLLNEAYALISEINNRAQGLTSVERVDFRNKLSNEIIKLLADAPSVIMKTLEALREG